MNLEQERCFQVLSALVKILHYGPEEWGDGLDQSLVSACLSLHRKGARLDPAFIRRALYLHPEETKIADADGNYPLHMEASIPIEKMFLLDAPEATDRNSCCGGACRKRIGLLQLIRELHPDAAKHCNMNGDYALNLIVSNGRPWDNTFASIVQSCPEAVHFVGNLPKELIPLIAERVATGCGKAALFAMFRARPAVLYE